jgi:hypothetical protein
MSNLGDLLDDHEPERLAKLAANDKISKARMDAMTQEMKDQINGVGAVIDHSEDDE